MTVETTELRLKAVLWPAGEYFSSDGEVDLGDPEEIEVRWEQTKTQQVSPGDTKVSKDIQLIVKVDIALGSQIWIGALADLPDPLTDLYTITGFQKVPDIKCSKYRRTITLVRKR